MSGKDVAPEIGNTLFLSDLPMGTIIHNIELKPGKGAAMARSAGSYAQLIAREGKYATVKLPSGETRLVLTLAVQLLVLFPMQIITWRFPVRLVVHAGKAVVLG